MNEKKGHVKILLLDDEDNVLIVKDEYKELTLPGGKVDEGESFLEAAKRELYEEVGVQVSDLTKVTEYDLDIIKNEVPIVEFLVHVFVGRVSNRAIKFDGEEILGAYWAPLQDINEKVLNHDLIQKYFEKSLNEREEKKYLVIR